MMAEQGAKGENAKAVVQKHPFIFAVWSVSKSLLI
jgi:hypothetical protein